jgi:DNA-binding beta-propeller fold protein YncE
MNRHLSWRSRTLVVAGLLLGGPLPVGLAVNDQTSPPPLRAAISPSVVRLEPGEEQRFKVTTVLARLEARTLVTNVRWSVNEIVGGSAEFGTIDPNGLYRAPSSVPTPREIRIRGEVEGVGNRYVWATVLMGNPAPSYEFVRFFGESVDQPERLLRPHAVVIDNDGNVIVVDENSHRVVRYTPEGKFLNEIGYGRGNQPGQFTKPRDAAVDADGLIYVSDEKSDRPRIQVFSRDGEFSRIFAEKGTGPGMLLRAHGMQFDQHQRLFVVDVDNARVNVYDRTGEFLYDWGKDGLYPGEFNAAHGLYVDPSGDVFISNYYGPVQKFTAEGKFLTEFGHGDPPDGSVHFHAIGGDRWGNVYVTVRNLGRRPNEVSIVKYNNNGDFVTSWRLSTEDREVNWVRTDSKGFVYAAFRGRTHMGVEVFQPR